MNTHLGTKSPSPQGIPYVSIQVKAQAKDIMPVHSCHIVNGSIVGVNEKGTIWQPELEIWYLLHHSKQIQTLQLVINS